MNCIACGTALPDQARFCPECGQSQAAQAAQAAQVPQHERRQITIVFCDLVESTVLANTLDAEDYHALIAAYQATCAEVITRLDGSIAQYLGDGLLVYFGYPRAHEDDPSRALRTALAILDAMADLNQLLNRERRLQVRIGIHTGLVVVGNIGGEGRQEQLAIGDAPNIASRLQNLAAPDSIVISSDSLYLIDDWYQREDLGSVQLVGITQAMHIYLLRRQGPSLPRSQTRPAQAAMFGREAESKRLRAAWRRASASTGCAVAISAEPGMGKSLLLSHLIAEIKADQGQVQTLRCSPYQASAEFQPLIDWVESRLGITPEDGAQERWAKLETGWPGAAQRDDVCLMAALLAIALPPGWTAPSLSPAVARHRTDALLAAWLCSDGGDGGGHSGGDAAESGPARATALFCEDLHWADPSTLAFLAGLAGSMAARPLLLVLSFRPEFGDPAIVELPGLLHLKLGHLSPDHAKAVIDAQTKGKALPPTILNTILERCDGVPLYLKEFTRAVLDSGQLVEHADHYELAGELPTGLIPRSLRDSLTARLDHLGSARQLAQQAAVIGRHFGADLLAQISTMGSLDLADGLVRLTLSGLVNTVAPGEYEFMHTLVQVAAYESMLKRDRVALHAKLAASLDQHFPELAERQPALVARHLTEAQQWAPAITRWLAVGTRSLVRSANQEAISQLREGLALLPNLPPEQSAPLELALLTTIGPALIATTGFASDAVGQTYGRTRELCELLGERPEVFPSVWGSWIYHHIRGDLRAGQVYARRMLAMGQASGSDALLVEAWWTQGNSHYWLGELAEADHCLATASALYDAKRHGVNRLLYGQDPGVAAECYRAYSLWQLGLPDQSLAALARAQELAARCDHVFSTAWVLTFEFGVYMYRREAAPALAAADRTLAFCAEHGTPFWIALARIVRGWARVMLGEPQAGIDEMREGMAHYGLIGSLIVQPFLHAFLAEALMAANRDEEAREAIATGLAMAARQEEKISEIDLWIAQGDWEQRQPNFHVKAEGAAAPAEAARLAYARAIALARSCGARSLALRAATRLHPLLVDAGQAASSELPELFAHITEGRGSRDWQAALAALQADPVS